MTDALLVALGAAVGGVLRLGLTTLLDPHARLGTLTANTAGSFVVGLAAGAHLTSAWWALLSIGFCGALTTWSSMSVQAVDEGWRRGSLLLVATVVLALGAASLGHALSQA